MLLSFIILLLSYDEKELNNHLKKISFFENNETMFFIILQSVLINHLNNFFRRIFL